MMNSADLSKQLIGELSQQPVNILRVRSLCRAYPGLIASAGLRLHAWTTLLLGVGSLQDSSKDHQDYLREDVFDPVEPCGEQHVLEADVHRTRAEIDLFRQEDVREYIRILLQKFCLDHEIQYKQGMNEVLAPLISLVHNNPNRPAGQQQHQLTYSLFKAILFRYLERFFCVDDSAFLLKAFRMFHLLLIYFDPQLANHLSEFDFTPEFYSPQWFLTLYARALPLPHVLRLWDMMIAVDDPSFTFFIGLCMLRAQRFALLRGDQSSIPEIISAMSFKNEDEIDHILNEAIKLYKITPRCILRQLRLCCVSTTELTPLPSLTKMMSATGHRFSSELQSMRLNVESYDAQLSLQAIRKCMMISPQELIDGLLPSAHKLANGCSEDEWDTPMHIPQQFVIIDIRSYEEKNLSGGGTLPRAIELDPEFLNSPGAFEVWLQHFDGTRGCNICVIDLPPAQWTGIALWRRLLLGEGDASSYDKFCTRYECDNSADSKRRLDALLAGKRTSESEVEFEHETELINADLKRPAMFLAMALQSHSFSNVSVLDGGFPALVDHLMDVRGSVEPIVINHEQQKWETFLRNSGRYFNGLTKSSKGKITKCAPQPSAALPRRVKDMSQLEILKLALPVAERLNHHVFYRVMLEKIQKLEEVQLDQNLC
jgi:hypothetical protein